MAITLTLGQAGATAYTVRDYYGTIVSTGPVAGNSFTISDPAGGWSCGWHRVYLTGPNYDPLYGYSYGAYSICVIRNTSGYPSNVTTSVYNSTVHGGEQRDEYLKGIMGMAFSRLQIANASSPTIAVSGGDYLAGCETGANLLTSNWRTDSARARTLLCQFPNGAVKGGIIGSNFLYVLEKDGSFTPGQVFFATVAGTTAGTFKLNVYSPDSSTLVESIDNISTSAATAASTINAASSYVKVFAYNGTYADTAVTDCGSSYRLGVRSSVAALYPLGVTRFEGPANEPRLDSAAGALAGDYTAHRMRLFQADVHAGNASAKAIGPCPVSLPPGASWSGFVANNGLSYCDELSFHAYNAITNGDFNLGRSNLDAFVDYLAANGGSSLSWWHTEATHVFTAVYGVHHPRRSRVPLVQTLLWEQYGLPRERDLVWYDVSHGFWSYPAWLENSDGSLVPYAPLFRTLSEETYGKTHDHPIDFGALGNKMLLGSVYTGSDNSATAVMLCQSHIPDATVTLSISGTTSDITYVDGWGNETTVAQTSGRVTVPVDDIPTYVRLPAGASCSVYSLLDWGASPPPSISPAALGYLSGSPNAHIGDNDFVTTSTSASSLPDTAELLWNSTVAVDRVIVVCPTPWQADSTLVDFDVQTTTDGTNWTTRATVTNDTCTSFVHGTNYQNVGCVYETFWDEQCIFNVPLGASYNVTGIRLYVRQTSQGGEPDASIDASQWGQGNSDQRLTLREIVVPSASTPTLWTSSYDSVVLADSPAGYWGCGDAAGSTTLVSQVNSPTVDATLNSGTLGSTGSVSDGSTSLTTSANGGGHVASPGSTLDVADNFTIEFLAKTGSSATYNYLFSQGNFFAPKLRFINGYMTLWANDGSKIVAQEKSASNDGVWHHWAITKNGSDVHIYKDSVDVTAATPSQVPAPFSVASYTFTNDTTKGLWFAGQSSADGFNGSSQKWALYGSALSAAAVLTHYQAVSSPTGLPVNSVAPSLSGTAKQGWQLQCSQGRWTANPTGYTYQWQTAVSPFTSWSNVAGATRSDYVCQAGDVGNKMRCQVTASSVAGTATAAISAVSSTVV